MSVCLSIQPWHPLPQIKHWPWCVWASWGEPPGGFGYSFGVWCRDAEAGSWGTLRLASRALNHPRVWVSIILECVPFSPKQLHLRMERGSCGMEGWDWRGGWG